MVGGAGLYGVQINKVVGSSRAPSGLIEQLNVPPGVSKAVISCEAVCYGTTVSIHLYRTLVGALAGGIIGLLTVLMMSNRLSSSANFQNHERLFTAKNLLYASLFLLLFGAIWYLSLFAIIKQTEPIPDIRFGIFAKYLGLLSAAVSWIAVGRKIQIGRTIPIIVNWVLLGPFNYVKPARFTKGQAKAFWVGAVLIFCLILFPPWNAFSSSSGGEGIGDSEFVGLHVFSSDQYGVLRDAPYVLAQINRQAQILLIFGIAVCTFLCVLYLGDNRYREINGSCGEVER